jgi:hypothetical protein
MACALPRCVAPRQCRTAVPCGSTRALYAYRGPTRRSTPIQRTNHGLARRVSLRDVLLAGAGPVQVGRCASLIECAIRHQETAGVLRLLNGPRGVHSPVDDLDPVRSRNCEAVCRCDAGRAEDQTASKDGSGNELLQRIRPFVKPRPVPRFCDNSGAHRPRQDAGLSSGLACAWIGIPRLRPPCRTPIVAARPIDGPRHRRSALCGHGGVHPGTP